MAISTSTQSWLALKILFYGVMLNTLVLGWVRKGWTRGRMLWTSNYNHLILFELRCFLSSSKNDLLALNSLQSSHEVSFDTIFVHGINANFCSQLLFHLIPFSTFSFAPYLLVNLIMFPPNRRVFSKWSSLSSLPVHNTFKMIWNSI